MMPEKLDENDKLVLQFLNDGRIVRGSQILTSTSLPVDAARDAVKTLWKHGLISYRGDLGPNGFPDIYVTVLPGSRAASDFLLKY